MATRDTANILVRAQNQTKTTFTEVGRDLNRLQSRFEAFSGRLQGLFVGGAIGSIFTGAVREAEEAERAINSVNAVLRATGFAAGLTRAELDALAEELNDTTIFDTDQVRQASAVLLTFRGIAGDTFKDALRSAADLSSLFGNDLQASIVQLGRALQNPAEGLNLLERRGVSFTQAQKDLIVGLAETNRLADAQRALLAAVEARVGGVAQEINQGLLGATSDLGKEWREFLQTLGEAGPVEQSIRKLTGALGFLRENIDRLNEPSRRLSQANPLGGLLDFQAKLQRDVQDLERLRSLLGFGRPAAQASQADVRRLDLPQTEEIARADAGRRAEEERRAAEVSAEARKKAAEEAKKASDTLARQVDQTIEGYRREVQGLQQLSAEQRVLQDIEAGRYRGLSQAQRARLLDAAREVDAARQIRTEEEATAASAREWADALREREDALDDQAESLRRLADPLADIREKFAALERIQADPLRALKPEVAELIRLTLQLQAIDLQFDGPVQDLIADLLPLRAVNFELDKTLAKISELRTSGEINDVTATELEVAARRRAADAAKDPEVERIRDAIDPTRQLREELERLQDLQLGGKITDEEYILRAEQITKQIEDINNGLREQQSLADELGFTFASAFEEAIIQGGNLRDIIRGLEQDIIRMVTRQVVTKPLADLIGNAIGSVGEVLGGVFGGGGTGGGGGFLDTIVSTFAKAWGGRQHGGPVQAGQIVEAGEAGPELAISGRMPRVLPSAIPAGKTVADVLGPDARPTWVGLNGPEPVQFDRPVRIIPHGESMELAARIAAEHARAPALPPVAPLADLPATEPMREVVARLLRVSTRVTEDPTAIPHAPTVPDAIGRRALRLDDDVIRGVPVMPAAPVLPDWAVERVARLRQSVETDDVLRRREDDDDGAFDRMLAGMFAGLRNGRELAEAVKHAVPRRRAGGPFQSNTAMWVGEEGPELVAFDRGGRVIPHAESMATGGGGNIYAPVTIVAKDLQSFKGAERQVARDLSRALSRAGRG